MILSDLFIIYLAAAAPFGVSRFLSEQAGGARTPAALLKGAGAALAWPFTSLRRLAGRASRRGVRTVTSEGGDLVGQRVERAKRASVNALRAVEDALEDACVLKDEAGRFALYAAREAIERYAGLALASGGASPEARPTAREMELCRIAGRGGDDLLTAGRCVHRRNVTRLVAHRERASAELTQALAAVRDLARESTESRRAARFTQQLRAGDPAWISEALARSLSRVAELTALLGDRATAERVARLLDAEPKQAGRAGGGEGEEEPCTTQAVPIAFASSTFPTSTSHGG